MIASVAKGQSLSGKRSFVLYSMFLVLMIDNIPGMGIGIGLGLSAKNLYLYFLVLLIAVKAGTGSKGLKFVDMDIHWPFILLIFYSVLTWIVSSVFDPTYDSLRGAVAMKSQLIDYYLFLVVFLYGVKTRSQFWWLLRVVVVTMFVSSFVTLIDFLNIPDLGIVGTYKGRLEGPFGAANQYGALLAFLMPISISLTPSRKGMARFFWIIGVIVTGTLLIATGSRGAYLAVFAGSIAAAFYLRQFLNVRVVARYAAIGLACLVLLLVVFAVLNPEFLLERFEKTTSSDIKYGSSGRIEIWTAVLLVMAEWPMSFIVGYGWNAYETSGIWKAAHNEYLDRLFELGAIGVLLFVAVLRSVPARLRRAIKDADDELSRVYKGYVFSMAIIFVDIVFVAIPDPWAIVWVVSGLMVGLSKTKASSIEFSSKRELAEQPNADSVAPFHPPHTSAPG